MFTLPFTYSWLIKKLLNKSSIKTILDLGCGTGQLGDWLEKGRYSLTGVDIFKPYLDKCRKKGKYTQLIKTNLTETLDFKTKSFDAVIALQTIEHLNKKQGECLVKEMERIARKIIIVSTPNGECSQDLYDENKYQKHLSSWTEKDFQERKYKVYGIGLKIIYGSQSHVQERLSIYKIPLYLISFLANPIANIFPSFSCQLVAVKNKK